MEREIFALDLPFGTIRSAYPSDTDGLLRMVGRLAGHHGDVATLTRESLKRDAFGPRPWIEILVAVAGGHLIGYAALCPLIRLQFGMRGLDLHHLFAEAGHRGHGVGTGLIESCKIRARAQDCGYLAVGTHPDNHAARAFYAARGFRPKAGDPTQFSLPLGD